MLTADNVYMQVLFIITKISRSAFIARFELVNGGGRCGDKV